MSHTPRVLVHGLGRFGGGAATIRHLHRIGRSIRVADKLDRDALAPSFASLAHLDGIDWQLGREDEALLDGCDTLVVNPAVPDHHPLVAAARQRGLAITQEISLFLEAYPGRTVLVTGTNGKSTTATLLADALRRGGVDALLGGNIGNSLLDEHARFARDQVAVVEISSFQLERIDPARHRATGAVFTPVTRDHVDRHGTLEAYHAAKARAARAATDFVVCGADDPVAASFATDARRLRHGGQRIVTPADGLDGGVDAAGWLWLRDAAGAARRALHRDALALVGAFHLGNALAALLAARELGAGAHGAALGVALRRPLPFRLQEVARHGGVRWLDNGVSTAWESTRSALDGLVGTRVHWVGGGRSKEPPSALPALAAEAASRLASAHVFGHVGPDLATALEAAGVEVHRHERIEGALASAARAARPGDAVLFSPGFASFDQYPNFRARAEGFHAWLAGPQGPRAAAHGFSRPAAGGSIEHAC